MDEFKAPSAGEFGAPQTRVILNPTATFFHLFFRFFPIFLYVFANYIFSFVSAFVFLVLLLSVDFWVVKNVSGRIMAGLRWWNYVDENGESRWIFESRSKEQEYLHSSTETKIFWGTVVIVPFLWVNFIFVSFWRMNLQWIILPVIGIVLAGTNLFGYLRCRFQGSDSAFGSGGAAAQSYLQKKVISNMISGFFSSKPNPQNTFQTV